MEHWKLLLSPKKFLVCANMLGNKALSDSGVEEELKDA